jgi:hypothetical protein
MARHLYLITAGKINRSSNGVHYIVYDLSQLTPGPVAAGTIINKPAALMIIGVIGRSEPRPHLDINI